MTTISYNLSEFFKYILIFLFIHFFHISKSKSINRCH